MRFEDLLARLPANKDQPVPVADQGEAFDTSPEPIDGFVAPEFEVTSWPEGASVLLVEAPGAVGKTSAAQALACRLRWPLVRAEKAQVGSYSLSGLIQDALGFVDNYIQRVAEGSAGVVVDSLDEAHFRSGTHNFLAFLENIQNVSGNSSSDGSRFPSVVLFSRSDTAELVRLVFADREFPLAEANLRFFQLEEARRFIESYLARRRVESDSPEYNVPLANPVPFTRLRNKRFSQVARVLLRRDTVDLQRDWASVEDFLGYAPVLIAVAESLAVTNPSRDQGILESASDESHLLRDIIDRILQREQKKFSGQILSKLQANLPVTVDTNLTEQSLYGPIEQITRVFAHVSRSELIAPPPVTLPQAIRDQYEQAATQFIADHPFIRGREFASIVFHDYVMATTCTDLSARAALTHRPEHSLENVGAFFAHFVAQHLDSSNTSAIPENLIEPLISSWSQEAELIRSPSDVLIQFFDDGSSLHCYRQSGRANDELALEFEIAEASGAFQVRKPLSNTTIMTNRGVILGSRTDQLVLGPNVVILADEVVIDAEVLDIEYESRRSGVVAIAARTLAANQLSKVTGAHDALRLFVDEPPPRLRGFMRELSIHTKHVPFEDYVDLRALLTSFKPSVSGGPSVYWEKLQRGIVKKNPNRRRLLQSLEERQIVFKDGPLYRLDPNQLNQLRFGLGDIKNGEPSDAVLDFLVKSRYPNVTT